MLGLVKTKWQLLLSFAMNFADMFRWEVTFPSQVYFLYLILGNLSAVINPVIYGLLNNNFWVEYKKIIFFLKKHNIGEEIQEQQQNETD